MARKAELLEEAQSMGLEVTAKNTIAEIEAAMKTAKASATTVDESQAVEAEAEVKTAKAGKRSAKALREADEKAAKEERKEKIATGELEESEAEKKGEAPKTRPHIERRSKAYRAAHSKIDTTKSYEMKDALAAAVESSYVKFDASVELHVRLNVDPKQADQNIRDNVVLPEGTGKAVRVAVFAGADDQKIAKAAGADIAEEEALLEKLKKEQIDFDVLISTPQMMAKLGQHARLLGPKGLMPNPKSGTVTNDIETAVKDAKAGKVEYRVDPEGIVHLAIGKVSFGAERLLTNAEAVMSSIVAAKPSSIKGIYIQSAYVTTTMGPSLRLDV